MLGNIVYVFLLDLENQLAVRQELNKDRFCKVINSIAVKGGSNDEKYMQYELQSLTTNKVYKINNYLSPYKFCDLKDLEDTIEKLSIVLSEDNKNTMKQTIQEINDIIEKA